MTRTGARAVASVGLLGAVLCLRATAQPVVPQAQRLAAAQDLTESARDLQQTGALASTTFASLRSRIQPADLSAGEGLQELTIRWDAFEGPPDPTQVVRAEVLENRFDAVSRRSVDGTLPAQRNPELSADQIAVVGVDDLGTERWLALIPDPRLIRAEFPGPDGLLSGEVLHRPSAEFPLALPAWPDLVSVRFYQPRWTGAEWVLDPLGSCSIPPAPRTP